jgi:predicted nucleotidyltransferase
MTIPRLPVNVILMNRTEDLIEKNKNGLVQACRKFGVRRLELFGSAVREDFDPVASDVDFIVSFADKSPGTYADRYLDFATTVERLLGRPVDLLTERSIRNPYFRREVDTARAVVYDERGQ